MSIGLARECQLLLNSIRSPVAGELSFSAGADHDLASYHEDAEHTVK